MVVDSPQAARLVSDQGYLQGLEKLLSGKRKQEGKKKFSRKESLISNEQNPDPTDERRREDTDESQMMRSIIADMTES